MTNTRADTDLFDADVLDEAARDHDVEEGVLADVAARHQASVEALPGVENIVYEWRKQYDSALVGQTDGAYYLAVPAWVWTEFGDALDVGEETLDALVELHRLTVVAQSDAESEPPDGRTYVALDRTVDTDGSDDE